MGKGGAFSRLDQIDVRRLRDLLQNQLFVVWRLAAVVRVDIPDWLVEEESLVFGVGTLTVIVLVAVRVPEVPVMVTW